MPVTLALWVYILTPFSSPHSPKACYACSFPHYGTSKSIPANLYFNPFCQQGNIIKWNVKVGDKVGPGDQICDVETDKATLGFEMQDEGIVAAILVPEGTKGVKVGTVIFMRRFVIWPSF